MKKSLFTGLAAVALASAAALAPATVFADATNAQGTTTAEFTVTPGGTTPGDNGGGDNGGGDNAALWLVKAPDLHFKDATVADIIAGTTLTPLKYADGNTTTKTGDPAENQDGKVEISDLRGSGDGWTLSASITDFTSKSTASVLTGDLTLGLTAGTIQNSKTAKPNSTTTLTTEADPMIIWKADGATKDADGNVVQGTGQGTNDATVNSDTALKINANPTVNAGTYDATITWTLGSAPTSAK